MDQHKKHDIFYYMVCMFMPILTCILVQYVLAMIEVEILAIKVIADYTGGGMAGYYDMLFEASSSSTAMGCVYIAYCAVCIPLFIYLYFKEFRDKKPLVKGVSDNVPFTILGIILFAIGAQYVCGYIMNVVAAVMPAWLDEYTQLIESAGLGDDMSFIMIIYSAILAPVLEEFAFRGITFKAARKIMPWYVAIIVQAILFGAFHMNAMQGIYAGALGLGLGYIMYRYDNLLITIIVHFVFNILGTVFSQYLVMGGNTVITFFLWVLGSLVVTYGGMVLLSIGAPGLKIKDNSADI